jgi:signal transduction histidine kinase
MAANRKLQPRPEHRLSLAQTSQFDIGEELLRDRKQILEELQLARAAADLANHAKDIFLANVSHELRTPLNGVLGMTDLLLESNLTEDQREMVEIARTSGELLLRIVTDLLDFNSIGRGCLALRAVPFSMDDLIDNVISLAASKARQKGLRLLVSQSGTVPPGFVGDPTRIKQILNNFLDNAIKFADSGDITVEAEVASAGPQRSNLILAVLDNGPGIAPEMMDQLFRPFTLLDASSTRRHCGMGMGLAISRCLAELMGGTVGVRSTLGYGSLFWLRLTLPLCDHAPVLALPF